MIKACTQFNGTKHPESVESIEVEIFLIHLAMNRTVSMSTQAIALNAIVFYILNFHKSLWLIVINHEIPQY